MLLFFCVCIFPPSKVARARHISEGDPIPPFLAQPAMAFRPAPRRAPALCASAVPRAASRRQGRPFAPPRAALSSKTNFRLISPPAIRASYHLFRPLPTPRSLFASFCLPLISLPRHFFSRRRPRHARRGGSRGLTLPHKSPAVEKSCVERPRVGLEPGTRPSALAVEDASPACTAEEHPKTAPRLRGSGAGGARGGPVRPACR